MSLALTLAAAAGAAAATYLVAGNLCHRVLAPLPAPDPATFPRAGDRMVSVAEGVVQEVHDVVDGWIASNESGFPTSRSRRLRPPAGRAIEHCASEAEPASQDQGGASLAWNVSGRPGGWTT